MSLCAFPTHPR